MLNFTHNCKFVNLMARKREAYAWAVVIGFIFSEAAYSENLDLNIHVNDSTHLIAKEPTNPQPSFESKFSSWGRGFSVRLSNSQNGNNLVLYNLAKKWAEPDERTLRYSIGIKRELPPTEKVDSREIYRHLLSVGSGLIVDDLNKQLPVLRMFSSGLKLSLDLASPFEEKKEEPKSDFFYTLEKSQIEKGQIEKGQIENSQIERNQKADEPLRLISVIRVPASPTNRPIEESHSSILPTWKFQGTLKPSFSQGPGASLYLTEATGFYQIEKSTNQSTPVLQKVSIPLPGTRITTKFVGKRPETTEHNPIYLQKGRFVQVQYVHGNQHTNIILTKNMGPAKIELTTNLNPRFKSVATTTLGYAVQI